MITNNNFAAMQVHQHLDALPQFTKSVITIGAFDGVHKGHQKIIAALQQEAEKIGGETVLITFHPHPRKIVAGNFSLQLINTLEEKIDLLSKFPIDHLVIVPFTSGFAEQSAVSYIRNFLVEKFHPHTIIIGYDHQFGKDRQGNFRLLEQMAPVYHYKLIEIPEHVANEVVISSTKIRKALLESDVKTANELLGYPFFFTGKVVNGDKLGRELGYPTANLEYTNSDKIHLGQGVYAVYVIVNDDEKKGMLSIGTRPTIGEGDEKVEVNIFDFDEEIYGQEITVIVKKYLRPQVKYNTLYELEKQLAQDKKDSLEAL